MNVHELRSFVTNLFTSKWRSIAFVRTNYHNKYIVPEEIGKLEDQIYSMYHLPITVIVKENYLHHKLGCGTLTSHSSEMGKLDQIYDAHKFVFEHVSIEETSYM